MFHANRVIDTLTSLGFERITDKTSTDYTLKWVEVRSDIDYAAFREGSQIVNHIANNGVITTKNSLYSTLKAYERVRRKTDPQYSVSSFLPQTFRMDVDSDRQEFGRLLRNPAEQSTVWIVKPTSSNQGRGIYLSNNPQELLRDLVDKKSATPVVQRYIQNPLLLDGHKFDMRIYMLIASVRPSLVMYHEGYCRLSHEVFVSGAGALDNLLMHLTNAAVQRKHPDHKTKGEDTIWPFAKFQQYLTDHQLAPATWVTDTLVPRVQEIMRTVFEAAKDKFDRRAGCFDLIGCDFMLDANLNVYLLECNTNPAMWTTCSTTKQLLPPMIDETLKLALEIHDKRKAKEPLQPLSAQQEFVTIVAPEKTI
jgi:predicted RNA-binding protein YlxR (DUF448 family)